MGLRQVHLAFVPLTAKHVARGQPHKACDMIRFIGGDPGDDEYAPWQQVATLRAITAKLSTPGSAWLTEAVVFYLGLVESTLR